MELVQQMKEDFFKPVLQRECQVHIALGNLSVWTARFAEKLLHPIGKVARQFHRAILLTPAFPGYFPAA